MNEQNLTDRRTFLTSVGAGLGLGLAGPAGALAFPGGSCPAESLAKARYRWVSVREIRGDGTHNAWPDICRWRDRYYVAFNSGGQNHGGGHGLTVRLLGRRPQLGDGAAQACRGVGNPGEHHPDDRVPQVSPSRRPADPGLLLLYLRGHERQPAAQGRPQAPLAEPEGIGGKLPTVGRPPQYLLPHRGQLQRGRPPFRGARGLAGPELAGLAASDLQGAPLHHRLPLPWPGVVLLARAGEHDSGGPHLRDVRERLPVQLGGRLELGERSAISPPRTTTRPTSISPRTAESWR